MKREISLDTETTGLNPLNGDRVIEIGCVEMINRLPTGKVFHKYIHPERDIPEEATKIHGITISDLEDKPKFHEIADDFLEFIDGAKLIIHNAEFDVKFLNSELLRIKKREIVPKDYFCTLIEARKKFPGARASLDSLCSRFEIDNSHRVKHGALLDAEILAEVYLELLGGRQVDFGLDNKRKKSEENTEETKQNIIKADFEKRNFDRSPQDLEAHLEFIKAMPNSLWNK